MYIPFTSQTLTAIAEEFSRLLHEDIAPEKVHTSTLLKNDRYCGRKFWVGNIVAVWKQSEPDLDFYDSQTGTLLAQLNLLDIRRQNAA